MKDIVIVLLIVIILFLFWNGRQASTMEAEAPTVMAAVPPEITQAIIEAFQKSLDDMVPIETLFIKPQGDGNYSSRFMFMNTKRFYGVQYDVEANVSASGAVTLSKVMATAQPTDYTNAYKPDAYKPYASIDASLNKQLTEAIAAQRGETEKQ